jgi:hypothetical protein
MDNRAAVREFLMSRRAWLTAKHAGLPDIGSRRVAGLRRSEVAMIAGVSVEYYAKLERGAIAGVSASVLDALAGRCSSTTLNGHTCSTLRRFGFSRTGVHLLSGCPGRGRREVPVSTPLCRDFQLRGSAISLDVMGPPDRRLVTCSPD